MKILLHICCGPCSIYPIQVLKDNSFKITGFFYRHNIHPLQECLKREETLKQYAKSIDIPVIYQKDYNLESFLQNVVYRESNRCLYCYNDRLISTAKIAKAQKFDYFSTTLLYSKFQKHDLIKSIAEEISKKINIPFYYHDFRIGWKQGIEESKQLKMYRQQYCGCIYSEKERYKADRSQLAVGRGHQAGIS